MKKEFEQHMTSIEIAEITEKSHWKVMSVIRQSEEIWKEKTGKGFNLEIYRDEKGKLRSCYSLTKDESLFVASGFSREIKCFVLKRWEQLEFELNEFIIPNMESDEEILEKADDIIAEELEKLNRNSIYCFTTTEIAKLYNMQAPDLNSFLIDKGILRKMNGSYELSRKYRNKGYEAYRYSMKINCRGQRKKKRTLVWTDAGREFLNNLIK